MKAYLSTIRLRIMLELTYRSAAIGGIVTQVFFGLILIFLYEALYKAGSNQSVTLSQTVSYVWLQQMAFRMLIVSDGTLQKEIMSGDIVYSLVRPINLYGYWLCRNYATKLISGMMRALPILPLLLLLPKGYNLMLPVSLPAFLCFFISLGIGIILMSAIESIMQAITMKTLDPRGITNCVSMLMFLFSGNLIPLTLFPDSWQPFFIYNPFAQGLDVAIRFYTGVANIDQFPTMVASQMIWLILIIALGSYAWKRNLSRMALQGG